VLADEQADSGCRRESADADVAEVAGAHPQPVGGECLRDVAPARAGTETDPAGAAVEYFDLVELPEVDDDPAVVGRAAADAVAAAADR
jgi:hypothetical protein